jgi:RNA polymerase sigma factor (sigma-70 family)
LYTIMRNIFINDYRKKAKQSVVLDNSPNDFLIDQTRTKVLNDGVTNLNLREVKQLIYDLPELFRTPFNLYFEGYKYNEIAEELNEPLGTIKSRIHFARKILKQKIQRY